MSIKTTGHPWKIVLGRTRANEIFVTIETKRGREVANMHWSYDRSSELTKKLKLAKAIVSAVERIDPEDVPVYEEQV